MSLQIQVIRSKHNPRAVRLGISGQLRKVEVTGETLTVFLDLDEVGPRLVQRVLPQTSLRRASGDGTPVPTSVLMAVEREVLARLLQLSGADAPSPYGAP